MTTSSIYKTGNVIIPNTSTPISATITNGTICITTSSPVEQVDIKYFNEIDENTSSKLMTTEQKLTKLLKVLEEAVHVLNRYSDKGNWSKADPNAECFDRFGVKGNGYELAEEMMDKLKEKVEEILKNA